MNFELFNEDCLEKLKDLPDESIDLVLSDFPYGINFMGKGWDSVKDNFYFKVAEQLKPKMKAGSFLVTTFTPRQDMLWRLLRDLEKAGFELKHSGLFWLYHTGFPKASDVSKGIDKRNSRTEEEYKALGTFLLNKRKELGLAQNEISKHFPSKTGGLTGCVSNWEKGSNVPTKEQWIILKDKLKIETKEFDELIDRVEAERKIIGKGNSTLVNPDGTNAIRSSEINFKPKEYFETAPALEESKRWSGFKSFSLKPAVECVVVAQKPNLESKK